MGLTRMGEMSCMVTPPLPLGSPEVDVVATSTRLWPGVPPAAAATAAAAALEASLRLLRRLLRAGSLS